MLAAQSPDDTPRVAFLGASNRVSFPPRNMPKAPGIQVAAICDIGAVAMATPAGTLKTVFVAAPEALRQLYGQKPMGMTPEES